MIPWIDEALKGWARAKRRLIFGQDGWPPRSVLGKLIDEGVTGAAALKYVQHHPEVLTGEALTMNGLLQRLPEELRTVIFAHYVVKLPAARKARVMGLSRDAYYKQLDKGHERLAVFYALEGPTEPRETVATDFLQTVATRYRQKR